jgi:hypothetical protein
MEISSGISLATSQSTLSICAITRHLPAVFFESNYSTTAAHTVIKSATEYRYKAYEDGDIQGVANALIIFTSSPNVPSLLPVSLWVMVYCSFIIFHIRTKIICESLYKVGKLWGSWVRAVITLRGLACEGLKLVKILSINPPPLLLSTIGDQ